MPQFLQNSAAKPRGSGRGFRTRLKDRVLRLFDSEKLTVDEIAALNHLAQEITAQLDHDALLKLIIERAVQLLKGVTGGIYLFDANKE